MPRALTLLPLLTLLVACGDKKSSGGPDDTGGPPGDGGGTTGDGGGSDGGTAVPTHETDCQDGHDEDQDGLADCLDDDCSAEWFCNEPDSLDFHSVIDFVGHTITCQVWGFDVDVDVDDCHADAVGTLKLMDSGNLCPGCDRSYYGGLSYTTDNCSDLMGTPLPVDAIYGYVFVDANTRELWSADETGAWVMVDTITSKDGHRWAMSGADEVWADPPDCDNGNQNIGRLSLSLSLDDR